MAQTNQHTNTQNTQTHTKKHTPKQNHKTQTHTYTQNHIHTHINADSRAYTNTHKHTRIQTNKNTHTHINPQYTHKHALRHTHANTHANTHAQHSHTHKQTNKQTNKHTDRQTNRQTDRQTDRDCLAAQSMRDGRRPGSCKSSCGWRTATGRRRACFGPPAQGSAVAAALGTDTSRPAAQRVDLLLRRDELGGPPDVWDCIWLMSVGPVSTCGKPSSLCLCSNAECQFAASRVVSSGTEVRRRAARARRLARGGAYRKAIQAQTCLAAPLTPEEESSWAAQLLPPSARPPGDRPALALPADLEETSNP